MSSETMMKTSRSMSDRIVETLGDVVVASLEATAQISLGQGLLRLADRFLWVVEKSAQWSLPVHEVSSEENGKAFGKIELVRPLPWIFFLPSLVILRACRFGVNIGAVILGYPKLQATGIVRFIQKGRRRLRNIKSNGLKSMRYRKGLRTKEDELTEAKKSLIKSMLSTLSALSCLETSRRTPSPSPTRLYVQHSERDATPGPEEQSTTESTSPQVDAKRKYSQVDELDDSSELLSDEEPTETKLDRLGNEDSSASDDQDFDPADEELMMASGSTSADEDDDDYVSDTELNDLHVDIKINPIILGGVIFEETEPEIESNTESKPEDIADAADNPVMDKKSTPNKEKTAEEKANSLELIEEIGTDNDKQFTQEYLTPITPSNCGENIADYFSPIDSPASVKDFKSPVADDAKEEQLEINKTPLKISKEPESLDFGGNQENIVKSTETSKISGNTQDAEGQAATTNGTSNEKGSDHSSGKFNHKGNKNHNN